MKTVLIGIVSLPLPFSYNEEFSEKCHDVCKLQKCSSVIKWTRVPSIALILSDGVFREALLSQFPMLN